MAEWHTQQEKEFTEMEGDNRSQGDKQVETNAIQVLTKDQT